MSLEMPKEDLAARCAAMAMGISYENIIHRCLNDAEYQLYLDYQHHAPLMAINDTPGLTIADIKAWAFQTQNEQGLDVLFVDYMIIIHKGAEFKGLETADLLGAYSLASGSRESATENEP